MSRTSPSSTQWHFTNCQINKILLQFEISICVLNEKDDAEEFSNRIHQVDFPVIWCRIDHQSSWIHFNVNFEINLTLTSFNFYYSISVSNEHLYFITVSEKQNWNDKNPPLQIPEEICGHRISQQIIIVLKNLSQRISNNNSEDATNFQCLGTKFIFHFVRQKKKAEGTAPLSHPLFIIFLVLVIWCFLWLLLHFSLCNNWFTSSFWPFHGLKLLFSFSQLQSFVCAETTGKEIEKRNLSWI